MAVSERAATGTLAWPKEKILATCPSNLIDLLHPPHPPRFLLFILSRCRGIAVVYPFLQLAGVKATSVEAYSPDTAMAIAGWSCTVAL